MNESSQTTQPEQTSQAFPTSDAGLILAIDLGTSSSRAMLYDTRTGEPAGPAVSEKHEAHATPDGGSTLDADALVAEVVRCVERVLARAHGRAVRGVAVSVFWHSIIGIDREGKARTPVLLWSDRRAVKQVGELREQMDALAYSARTGCPLHVSYVPGKLRYVAETDAETWAACTRWVSPGEYLFGKLFGWERVTASHSMASATGLFDQTRQEWDKKTLALVPGMTGDKLSPVSDEPVSGLGASYRDTLAAVADVPWFPALGDGACSNMGCGAVTPDTMALMVGTSGALRVMVPGETPPALPPGLWRYQADTKRFLLGGALSNGGSVWAWLKRLVHLPDVSDDELEAQIAALPPDGHGLTVLPFLAGERAPLWRDDLRATIHGLSSATTPIELARAHLEAVALRFAVVRQALEPIVPVGSARILGTGAGLIASPTWAQIIADAVGEPLLVSSEEQASSRGAVLWVRERLGLGHLESAPLPPVTQTITPNTEAADTYRRAGERQAWLLKQVDG